MRSRGLLAVLAFGAMLLSACQPVVQIEAADPVEFVQQPQTSHVLALDGTELAALHAEQDRRDVRLDQVHPLLVDAVVAVEDRRFFGHLGVDLKAIARAAFANAESGEIEQGGSTITQQYVKNTMTGTARTLERKLKEAALAMQLEARYDKDEILERYLNTVYFGRGAYGVHAASERFFRATPDKLTLDQAAMLAGMIQSPSTWDPISNPADAVARRAIVLDAMVETGRIDEDEAAAAAATPLDLEEPPTYDEFLAPHVVEEVKRQIIHDPTGVFAPVLGGSRDERAEAIFTGGIVIETTLDLEMQAQAENAVATILSEEGDPAAAVVTIDPTSGAIRAMVGGRDFYDTTDPVARFNLATQARRQPGSSFKPIALAAALERGVQLDRVFPAGDCVSFTQVEWELCNYAGISYPELTLREATVKSANTAYARVAVELGGTALLEQARTMGFTSDMAPVPSLALGTASVSPLEMASAYASFASLGIHHEPHVIARITTVDGEVLWEHEDRSYRVLETGAAYLVRSTLEEVVQRGTGVRAAMDRPVAGKTGTSQNNADAWFVGFTPEYATAVWVGFPEGSIAMRPPTTREVVEGGRWPAEIWRAYMGQALSDMPVVPFPDPDLDLVTVTVDITRNCLPNAHTPPNIIGEREFLAGTEPTRICTEPAGPPLTDVPDVTNLPVEVALRVLAQEGFEVDQRPVRSKVLPTGYVAKQRPDGGGLVADTDGAKVVVWISVLSHDKQTVPDVTGMDPGRAVAALESGGWVPTTRRGCPRVEDPEVEPCDGIRPGTVWLQRPEAGAREARFSEVTVWMAPD